jgi:hypothetical protein
MRISAAGDAGSAPIVQRPGKASSHLLFPCCYKAQGSRVAIRVMAMTKSKTLIFCPPHHCRRAAEQRDELASLHSICSGGLQFFG